ncbi:MOSC domain-containing protein [Endozoicomonas sp. SM1973]|uniref:MOSC domain-containing protein n=1 Tax=Spartinivicinus marinus TaxID=2994442 RepID=A0A853I5X1_9GAMM|nr:MOSC domain-containing protein [Spartinivicinus marinus]MCX4025934.1 MOSC domain-containing protein [Spartinivicinus marinus]NYZ68119.1 MOSC domain-containing protein [Spartinivicinus marinus]
MTLILTGTSQALGDNTQSAINKVPIRQPVFCSDQGLETDEQYEERFHGGPERALHFYPSEHYAYWETYWQAMQLESPGFSFKPGVFGENLSDNQFDEDNCHIGDIFKLGEAVVQISQPRSPCYKLNIQFNYPQMSVLMQANGKTGWLLRVLQEGMVKPADQLELLETSDERLSVRKCADILYNNAFNQTDLEHLAAHNALSKNWRRHASHWLEDGKPNDWTRRLLNK